MPSSKAGSHFVARQYGCPDLPKRLFCLEVGRLDPQVKIGLCTVISTPTRSWSVPRALASVAAGRGQTN
jgi:hypothetical protein